MPFTYKLLVLRNFLKKKKKKTSPYITRQGKQLREHPQIKRQVLKFELHLFAHSSFHMVARISQLFNQFVLKRTHILH